MLSQLQRLNRRYQEEANEDGSQDSGTGDTAVTDNSGDGGDNTQVTTTWPDDWRNQMTGGDEKQLAQAERYNTPKDIWNANQALQQKISSGELVSKNPFPSEGTDEEKSAWREGQGLPVDPSGYNLEFGDGLTIGEEDAPVIDAFKEAALNSNMSPDQVKNTVEWYYKTQEAQAEARAEQDQNDQQTFEDTYRAEWGNDYRANLNKIHALLDGAPEGVKEDILQGRGPDGMAYGNKPNVMNWLAGLARAENPTATLVPAGGQQNITGINEEIAKIDKFMRTNSKEYYADNAMQQRYRDLLTAQEKMRA